MDPWRILYIFYTSTNGINLDIMERFYIYTETTTASQLNDKYTNCPMKIFEIITNEKRH